MGTATGVVSPLLCVEDSVTEVAVDVVDEVVLVVDELVVDELVVVAGSGIRVGGDSTISTNSGCGAWLIQRRSLEEELNLEHSMCSGQVIL